MKSDSLRVLHLFSNCKWTGPAEPALNLCLALRRMGVAADFACAPDAGRSINKIVETARDRGLEPMLNLHLYKHKHPVMNLLDHFKLKALLRRQQYDLIHCHLDNDHRIAWRAAGALGIPLVRSSYEGDGLAATRDHARLLRTTRFLVQPSRLALEQDQHRFGFPQERMALVPGAVDTERFDPRRETPDGRRWLNLPPDAFVLGIVARMQTHRRYEDLFLAFRRLLDEFPAAHLVVVGRGTNQEKVGFRPVEELGLQGHVHFTGYVDGENYVGMLAAADAGVYLVPGSDGTCRAARELMAMGKPMVVTPRGMLPEIVTDNTDGLLTDGSAEGLHAAFRRLASERELLRNFSAAARKKALSHYSLEAQARSILEIYARIL